MSAESGRDDEWVETSAFYPWPAAETGGHVATGLTAARMDSESWWACQYPERRPARQRDLFVDDTCERCRIVIVARILEGSSLSFLDQHGNAVTADALLAKLARLFPDSPAVIAGFRELRRRDEGRSPFTGQDRPCRAGPRHGGAMPPP